MNLILSVKERNLGSYRRKEPKVPFEPPTPMKLVINQFLPQNRRFDFSLFNPSEIEIERNPRFLSSRLLYKLNNHNCKNSF